MTARYRSAFAVPSGFCVSSVAVVNVEALAASKNAPANENATRRIEGAKTKASR